MFKLALVALTITYAASVNWPAPPPPVLNDANFHAKFDELEKASRDQPGELARHDIVKLLGRGEVVPPTDPDLAGAPPGVEPGRFQWMRWGWANETLLVGFANGRMSQVVRYYR